MRLVSRAQNQRDLAKKRSSPLRVHRVVATREELAEDVRGSRIVMPVGHRPPVFRCVKCKQPVTGAAMFCDLHLWIIHPVKCAEYLLYG